MVAVGAQAGTHKVQSQQFLEQLIKLLLVLVVPQLIAGRNQEVMAAYQSLTL
jgi:hypothetical protein